MTNGMNQINGLSCSGGLKKPSLSIDIHGFRSIVYPNLCNQFFTFRAVSSRTYPL